MAAVALGKALARLNTSLQAAVAGYDDHEGAAETGLMDAVHCPHEHQEAEWVGEGCNHRSEGALEVGEAGPLVQVPLVELSLSRTSSSYRLSRPSSGSKSEQSEEGCGRLAHTAAEAVCPAPSSHQQRLCLIDSAVTATYAGNSQEHPPPARPSAASTPKSAVAVPSSEKLPQRLSTPPTWQPSPQASPHPLMRIPKILSRVPRCVGSRQGSRPLSRQASQHSSAQLLRQASLQAAQGADAARPTVPTQWLTVFNLLQRNGEVSREKLSEALEMAGFVHPETTWIEDALDGHRATLSRADFFKAIAAYEERVLSALTTAMSRRQADDSGPVETDGLAALLDAIGMTPLEEVVREMLGEVQSQGFEKLSVPGFRRMMEISRAREGFALSDIQKFKEAFSKFNRGLKTLKPDDFLDFLCWLGFASGSEEVCAAVRDVSTRQGSGQLDERRALAALRKLREREVNHVRRLLSHSAWEDRGLKAGRFQALIGPGALLERLLSALGYCFPEEAAIRDAAQDAGLLVGGSWALGRRAPTGIVAALRAAAVTEARSPLNFTEAWQFLIAYRSREGLSRREAADVDEAFQHCDAEAAGRIRTSEVGRVLRLLGYCVSWELQQHLVAEVDVDSSGWLSTRGLYKLVRKHRERDLADFLKAFRKYEHHGALSPAARSQALRSLGFTGSSWSWAAAHGDTDEWEELLGEPQKCPAGATEGEVDASTFVRLAVKLRMMSRERLKSHTSCSAKELEELRRRFECHDVEGRRTLRGEPLRQLLDELVLELGTSAKKQPWVARLLGDAHDGIADFSDFLRLARQLRELWEQDQVVREEEAVRTTGFNAEEVQDFRALFSGSNEGLNREELTLPDVKRMIGRVCPLPMILADLSAIFRELASPGEGGEHPTADFPEFLLLMRRLLDVDLGGLAEHVKRATDGTDGEQSCPSPG